jgi:uncharacterized protein YjbJ (UPF0337 family)
MSFTDKVKNKIEQFSGKAKQRSGHATGNTDLEAKGRNDQTTGHLKDAGEDVKDAFKNK